ncbi:acyltransferase family protein [Flaviaesturariibacter terrae]
MPPASSSRHLPALDHLRALAILLVFFYHYGHLFPHPAWTFEGGRFGWTGVDLFFVLSGYLIAGGLFSELKKTGQLSLRRFYIRRFWRIIPPYVLVLMLYWLVPVLRERGTPAPLWKYLTFTQNIGLDLGRHSSFSHAWSLCIEEQFYALFPLLLLLTGGRRFFRGHWRWTVVLPAGILTRYLTWNYRLAPLADDDRFALEWLQWIYYPTWCRLDGLLTGIGIAALQAYRPALFQQLLVHSRYWLLVGCALLAGASFLCFDQLTEPASVFGYPIIAIGYGFLLLAALAPSGFLRQRLRLSEQLAAYSYSLYLLHKISIHTTQRLLGTWLDPEGNAMLLACLATTLLAAWLLHVGVEKPALRLREKILRKKSGAGQPAGQPAHLP